MYRRWFVFLFAAMMGLAQDGIGKQRAVQLAGDWARRNRSGLGRRKTPLQFDKATATEESWKNDRGELRKVWLVYFPENDSRVEPSGLAVRVDRETGRCERAILE